jgi:hypothetical protein
LTTEVGCNISCGATRAATPPRAMTSFWPGNSTSLATPWTRRSKGLLPTASRCPEVVQMIRTGVVQDATTVAAMGLLHLKRLLSGCF